MSTTITPEETGETARGGYNWLEVESKWTESWHKNKVFNLDINPDKPPFSIALPPPNITGNLHMGHALNGTLQDVLIRLKRMQGYNVLWQPGTDHAGISTQIVVERQLKKEGKNRHELGREKFVERVWEWRNQYGNQILSQYKRLGVSFAWDRIAFTLDDSYVQAIYRAFVTLFKEGLIYRGNRITNWCPRDLTSLSDLEVEHEDEKGFLYHIRYGLSDGSGALTVATTRPETMFGDVAVAVHPDDDRYKQFIGKSVKLPLTNRTIPVIADEYVERDFGTGALKITPAHDANDWEVGQRHKLESPVVIDSHGKLMVNEFVPEQFQGKDRFDVRDLSVTALEEAGLLAEKQDYVHGVSYCERCHTVIEPYLSDQWFLAMKELAAPAILAVEEERVNFVPERYAQTCLERLKNIKDWNISRQLWWGHRIPVWTCENEHVDAYETAPDKCSQCASVKLSQDEDVLDTWFSSALWPFATLGWPNESIEYKVFYPTTVLSTAREIINLWVSRMIFMSLKFLKKIPFKDVVIHPVIQTADGKRMSKSKNNAIDPLVMIEKYGADANRFWFMSVGVKGDQDVRFREDRLDEYKKFANKLWNCGRFVLSQLTGYTPRAAEVDKLSIPDRWILHRYNKMLQTVSQAYNDYDFHVAARELYDFTWDSYCDWYLEIAKIQLAKEDAAGVPTKESQTKRVLHVIFEGLMRSMHPIMPFITEELWEQTPKSELFKQLESVMFAPYPRADERFFNAADDESMQFFMRVITSIRNMRQTFNVPASADAEIVLVTTNSDETKTLEACLDYIKRLAKVSPTITTGGAAPAMAARDTISETTIYLPLSKLIDVSKSRLKLEERANAVRKELAKAEGMLNNPGFKTRAPQDKIDAMVMQVEQLTMQLKSIQDQLKILDEKQ
jgi:valyl-tRNA synthetase